MWFFEVIKSVLEKEICQTLLDISGCKVKLYWLDTTILTDAAAFDTAYRMLPCWRRDKADLYLHTSDKRLSVGAGLLLQRGLADCGVSGQDAAVACGQYGKPWLPEHPEIHFNLSRAGRLAVAVFADTDVGCDVEQVRRADMELAKKFFCAGEYGYLARLQAQREFCESNRSWTGRTAAGCIGDCMAAGWSGKYQTSGRWSGVWILGVVWWRDVSGSLRAGRLIPRYDVICAIVYLE